MLSMSTRWRQFALGLLLAIIAAAPLFAVEPVLDDIQPRGGQRGKTFTLTLKGKGLTDGADLITSLPATITKFAAPKNADTGEELAYLIQLSVDAAVGAYPLRVHTASGLSNVQIFTVSDLPEIPEKEPNDSIAQAQPLTFPIAVTGTLTGPDEDFYAISVAARQRLVLEVEARRIGSAIDPVIVVWDSAGRQITENDDGVNLGVDSRLDMTFPKAGRYFVEVHDSKYSDQTENFYRLLVGEYPYADGMFPLGWQRGKSVDVTLFGSNLPKPVVVHLNLNVPAGQATVPIALPGPRPLGTLPFQFVVSDLPETLAAQAGSVAVLQPSTMVNGRILKPGEVDRYKLTVSPGEKWLINLQTSSLGTSALYGSLTLYDEKGKKLETKDVSNTPDPEVSLTVPDKVHEVTLAVGDVRGQAGATYAYRLSAQPGEGDFSLKLDTPYANVPVRGTALVKVVAERHGFEGPIHLSIPNLPKSLTVAGGDMIGTVGYLTISANPDAKPEAWELQVWGEGGPPEHPIRHKALGPGEKFTVAGDDLVRTTEASIRAIPTTYPWLGLNLPVALGETLPVTLTVAVQEARAVQGMDYPIPFKLIKTDPTIVTKKIEIPDIPFKDASIKNRADFRKDVSEGTFLWTSSTETPLGHFDLIALATVILNGEEKVIVAPAVSVNLVGAYTVELKTARIALKSGGKVELAGVVRREPVFKGTVNLSVGGLPDKVTCAPVELPDGKSEFQLTCEANPGAPDGEFDVHLVSSAVIPGYSDKQEYKYPPLMMHMTIGSEKVAQGGGTSTPRDAAPVESPATGISRASSPE